MSSCLCAQRCVGSNLGVTLAKQKQYKAAIAKYRMALNYYPKSRHNYRIHFNIALALAAEASITNDLRAIGELAKCLKQSPYYHKAQRLMTSLEERIANHSKT